MTTIKQYNAGTASWETIVVGKQGQGVPTGGTAGQILVKNSSTDYDSAWVAGGMRLIKTQTVGTGVSSVVVSDVFSSTYDDYLVIAKNVAGSSTAYPRVRLTFGSASAAYYSSLQYVNTSTGGNGFDRVSNGAYGEVTYVGNGTKFGFVATVTSPNLAQPTMFTGTHGIVTDVGYFSGALNDTTAYTAFTLTPAAGTLTGGTIAVYGYVK